jgi:hypothetical protein
MKKVILFCGLLVIMSVTGCSSTPKPIAGTEHIEKMERREVIQAVTECEDEGMRPYVNYVTQKTEYGKQLVPVDVFCMPKRKAN